MFAQVIIATATDRAELHAAGIHVCVEMLIDGISVSYKVPKVTDYHSWELLRRVLQVVQDILWHSGFFTEKATTKAKYDKHTWVCNGTWDIQWPELNETGAITFDDGGQQQWN